jgi:glycogen phosphorylase
MQTTIEDRSIAYFSMELAVNPDIPTYAGGLGVLAGDTVRAAADMSVPMVAVSLLHRRGYFFQKLDSLGMQTEEPAEWVVQDYLSENGERCSIEIEGRHVEVRAWKYEVKGITGYVVPVYFLDTDLPENSEWDRTLSHYLYGGDDHYRLCQEVVLGIGGVRMLGSLGYKLERFHMNEGHASLLALELLEQEAKKVGRDVVTRDDVEAVKKKCIFTTHTPVAAGHDKFEMDLVLSVLGKHQAFEMEGVFNWDGKLNMTHMALNLSHYVNGVAKKHGEISRLMFAGYRIDSITNGIHVDTWTSEPFARLFDQYIPGWRQDNFVLRSALAIPKSEIWAAHSQAKKQLIQLVNQEMNAGMDIDFLTIGFARRATEWKRPDLLFYDLERIRSIVSKAGPIQIIYAGKAHPNDRQGKEMIQKIFRARDSLKGKIKIVYLPNYDWTLAKRIVSGVDLWLNSPRSPQEASGTSGMKAAVNGVPSLSILDGWWIEGHIEGITGWTFGSNGRTINPDTADQNDALSLYDKLEQVVMPIFYSEKDHYVEVMLHAIALNGSFFNTHRMIQQYVLNAYFK